VARHRLLARPAAVKLIRPELMGPDSHSREALSRRFEREARATALLGSTHTVDVYDYGRSEDGAFFYVMELLDGMSVDTLIRRHGPITSERAVYLLKQVCHSLGEAHERELIHRDIKPANIFVCRLGPDYDFVKVLDFGLVKGSTADSTRHGAHRHGCCRRHAGLHGAGDGNGQRRHRRPGRPVRARLRGLLDADRPAGL
jgi:serine/threonine-protein kinase